jgi:hypothetical protein
MIIRVSINQHHGVYGKHYMMIYVIYHMHLICMVFILHYDIIIRLYSLYAYIYIWLMFTSSHLWFIPVVQRRRPPKVTINLGRAEAFEQKLELLGLLR